MKRTETQHSIEAVQRSDEIRREVLAVLASQPGKLWSIDALSARLLTIATKRELAAAAEYHVHQGAVEAVEMPHCYRYIQPRKR